jgi:hypothetical protein
MKKLMILLLMVMAFSGCGAWQRGEFAPIEGGYYGTPQLQPVNVLVNGNVVHCQPVGGNYVCW